MKHRPLIMTLLALGLAQTTMAQEYKIDYSKETLENGLRVIYAPLKSAPVVHVRVLYHVGSRDERPERQGFAHMFEHMMFRGSSHVAPEQHMKLIGAIGGDSNAFTSFDQTTYHQTLPNNNTEMALYLEADRMASFKVNDQIFQTERKVVAEEWRMRYANQPLGSVFQDLLKTAFTNHSYRWTPIGDMDQLRQASSSELQTFFNTYYVPNNACLIISGDFDQEQTRQWVRKYFGWIPKGPDVLRTAPVEPKQTETRRLVVTKPNVPLTNLYLGFKVPDYKNGDHEALSVLGDILASGRTGRLDRALVYNAEPKCVRVGAGDYQLEDPSLFVINAVVAQGADEATVEKQILDVAAEIAEKGVTQEEVDKIRTQMRQQIVRDRESADDIAKVLGEEEVFGGDAARVNQYFAKLDAIKPEDVQRVAKAYLTPQTMTVVSYRNGPAAQPTDAAKTAEATANAQVVASTQEVIPRVSAFPQGYPAEPPVNREALKVVFNKGVESTVNGVKVITLTDNRLPLVSATLLFRGGGHSEPAGKEGLASLTAQMLRRGSEGVSFLDLSQDLESRGIAVEAADAGDNTRLSLSCTSDQLDYAVKQAALILSKPVFPDAELQKLKRQSVGGLIQSLSSPSTVVQRTFVSSMYEDAPQGRLTTPQSLGSITIDDVKAWYDKVYSLDNAFLIISGDVTPEQGTKLAQTLLAGYERKIAPPKADYTLKAAPEKRRIILVDNPQGKQATIRIGLRAYDIRSEDKFAGSVAGQILSSGIDSRLGKYVRAEKGLTYGVYAYFRPSRQAGEFSGTVDTDPSTAAAAVEAMFKVFGDMRKDLVTNEELAEAKTRVAGGMAMEIQTIAQQAQRRVDQILNDYPIDYYDVYPTRIAQVTAEQVRAAMQKYVLDDRMLVVVVAPAAVKEQLEKLGTVEVVPMPSASKPATAPAN